MEICTSHFNEDLTWLEKSQWPVTVIHKEGGYEFPSHFKSHTIPNEGYEASSYLYYIITRYDTLPDHVAFIHGHETAQHQLGDRPLLDMIKDANISKYNYIPINNFWNCVLLHTTHYYLKPLLPEFPDMFITCAGAQFVVSKEAIRRNPLEFYTKMYESTKTKNDAVRLELSWHLVFTNHINCIPRDDFFIPAVKKIKYSSSCNIPMQLDELRFVYVGKTPCDSLKDNNTVDNNNATTYLCAKDDTCQVMNEEVFYYNRHKLHNVLNNIRELCLMFNDIYTVNLLNQSHLL